MGGSDGGTEPLPRVVDGRVAGSGPACGLRRCSFPRVRIVSTTAMCTAIQAAIGVDAHVVRGMHLSAFDGSAVDLASGGARLEWWRLGWAAVCPIHEVLLVDRCLHCGVQIRRGAAGQPLSLSRARVPDVLACGSVLSQVVCIQPITQITASAARPEVVVRQRMLLDEAERRRLAMIAGHVVSARQWFSTMKAIAVLGRWGCPRSCRCWGRCPPAAAGRWPRKPSGTAGTGRGRGVGTVQRHSRHWWR